MARRAFFSFHYERDIDRSCVVRNSWHTQDRIDAGFFDNSLWEEAKRNGDQAIKRMIDGALFNTSVTVVLIGTETASRPYVQYEIDQSINRGNGLLGVRIHRIKNLRQETDFEGPNPFDNIYINYSNGGRLRASSVYQTYDYVADNGYQNLGNWIEAAARAARK